MTYDIEELIPIISSLAGKYTSHESTSITYEKAEQLLGAVRYIIRETEHNETAILTTESMSAEQAYESGLRLVREKTKKALSLFNEIIPGFNSYGVRCYSDTVRKGLPEFFRWYDVKFAPQETILTLDYPVLYDLSEWSGIDRIERYLHCIELEQEFLQAFTKVFIEKALLQYNEEYKEMIDNVCPAILTKLYAYFLLGKPITEEALAKKEAERLGDIFLRQEMDSIRIRTEDELAKLISTQYGDRQGMLQYLLLASKDVLLRMRLVTTGLT